MATYSNSFADHLMGSQELIAHVQNGLMDGMDIPQLSAVHLALVLSAIEQLK
jgi:hypothetical protein